jgi:hypothetical protein
LLSFGAAPKKGLGEVIFMLLDKYLSEHEFNEVHTINIQAPPEKIFRALKELTPSELSPVFRFLFAIRSLPARLMGQDDKSFSPSKPLLEQLYENDFVVLAETERELVFGLIGKFWELSGGESVQLAGAQEFLKFDQPDYAKAAANFFVSKNKDDSFTVSTETRIHIADLAARKKFGTYWRIIYPGSAYIRKIWLKAIKRKAEQ